MNAINPKQKALTVITLLCVYLFTGTSIDAQNSRYLEFKMPDTLNADQWRSLKMDPEDKDLLIYLTDLELYYLFSGDSWVEIGSGGDITSPLSKNSEILGLREAVISNLEEADPELYRGVPRLKKEQREQMQLSEEDRGLLIHQGEYMVYTGTQWNKLGKGGNFGRVLNRQGSIEGLKEGFLYSWKQAYGFGLYVARPYASFFRDETYPSNPMINGLTGGWEVGLAQNLLYRRFVKAQVYIGYTNINLREIFNNGVDTRLTADWKFAGPTISLMPLILTPGTNDIKLTIGAGAYARYYTTMEITTDGDLPIVVDPEEDMEKLDYGFRAQVGLQIYRFNLILSATNQYNNIMSSEVVQFNQEIRHIRTKTYALNLQFNF